MNVIVRHKIMSIEDFLAWEARQERKYEFDGEKPVAMTGGSRNHARVQRNLAIALGQRLAGSMFEFLGSDMKLVTPIRVRYPDGQVVHGDEDGDAPFMTTPVVVFEVASPSSRRLDLGRKATDYARVASVQQYIVLEQDQVAATMHERSGSGWGTRPLLGAVMLDLPGIGISLSLAELYHGVTNVAA